MQNINQEIDKYAEKFVQKYCLLQECPDWVLERLRSCFKTIYKAGFIEGLTHIAGLENELFEKFKYSHKDVN